MQKKYEQQPNSISTFLSRNWQSPKAPVFTGSVRLSTSQAAMATLTDGVEVTVWCDEMKEVQEFYLEQHTSIPSKTKNGGLRLGGVTSDVKWADKSPEAMHKRAWLSYGSKQTVNDSQEAERESARIYLSKVCKSWLDDHTQTA